MTSPVEFTHPDSGYPVCSDTCARGLRHAAECKQFVKCGWKYQGREEDYAAITVLR